MKEASMNRYVQDGDLPKLVLVITCFLLLGVLEPRYAWAEVTGTCCNTSVLLSEKGAGNVRTKPECFDCKEYLESGAKSWEEYACKKIKQMGPLGRVTYATSCGAVVDCSQVGVPSAESSLAAICQQLGAKGALCDCQCDVARMCYEKGLASNPAAQKLWQNLLDQLVTSQPSATPQSTETAKAIIETFKECKGMQSKAIDQEAIRRFLQSCEGAQLLNALWNMDCPSEWGIVGCKMQSRLKFKLAFCDQFSPGTGGELFPEGPYPDAQESDPRELKDRVYVVRIQRQGNAPVRPPYFWPGKPLHAPPCTLIKGKPCDIQYTFSDGASEMAATIYHELLHIWFMNEGKSNFTGHGSDLTNCEDYDPRFLKGLAGFYGGMDGIEKCLKP